jgi:hypothetical protein
LAHLIILIINLRFGLLGLAASSLIMIASPPGFTQWLCFSITFFVSVLNFLMAARLGADISRSQTKESSDDF